MRSKRRSRSLGYVRNRARPVIGERGAPGRSRLWCARTTSRVFYRAILSADAQEHQHGTGVAEEIQLVLLMVHSPRDYQIASRYLRSGHVDGAVLVSMHGRSSSTCTASACPWCWAGRPFGNDERDLSYVDVDNVGGARMAVRYLLESGHAAVATVAGPPDMSPAWTACAVTARPWPRPG